MNITVAKKDLLRLVGRCQGVADKKNTMPVLANVLVNVDGPNRVRIAATDLYLAISGHIPAEVKQGGSTAVPAKDFFERVKTMPDGPVTLSVGSTGHARSNPAPRNAGSGCMAFQETRFPRS